MPRKILTPAQVREIRDELRRGRFQSFLAAYYGVSQQTISAINKRHRWKRVTFDDRASAVVMIDGEA